MKTWVTRSELAKVLKIHLNTVDNLRKKNRIPYTKAGRSIRFPLEDVERVLLYPRQGKAA